MFVINLWRNLWLKRQQGNAIMCFDMHPFLQQPGVKNCKNKKKHEKLLSTKTMSFKIMFSAGTVFHLSIRIFFVVLYVGTSIFGSVSDIETPHCSYFRIYT